MAEQTMFPRGAFALKLASQGYRIFPIWNNSKKPAIKQWPQKATTNPETIKKWWSQSDYNIGIACGRPDNALPDSLYLVVVDYDFGELKQGRQGFGLHARLGWTNTYRVRTPSGGMHCYFWCKTKIGNSVSRVHASVDVRGHHGYVLGPGSMVGGKHYTHLTDSQPMPTSLPMELEKLALTRSETEPTSVIIELNPALLDSPAAIERAKSYLINSAPEAIEGAGGDTTTFNVAQRLRAFGLSQAKCAEMMKDYYNEEKCSPPWSDEELETKVRNAYAYARMPPGSANPDIEFGTGFAAGIVPAAAKVRQSTTGEPMHPAVEAVPEPVTLGDGAGEDGSPPPDSPPDPGSGSNGEPEPSAFRQTQQWRPKFLRIGGWDDIEIPARLWAVFERIPLMQVGLFSGEGGTGKSIIELMRCIAHVAGIPWFGMEVTQRPALYLGAEDDDRELQIRLMLIARYLGLKLANLEQQGLKIWGVAELEDPPVLVRPCGNGRLETTKLFTVLLEYCGDVKPISIVLDPLSLVYAGSELDRAQVYWLFSALRKLARVSEGSVTLLGHPSLQGISSGSGLSGSTAFHGAPRFRMYLKGPKPVTASEDEEAGAEPDTGRRTLHFLKSQYGARGPSVDLQWKAGLYIPVSEFDRAAAQKWAKDTFLQLLRRFWNQGRYVSHKVRSGTYAPKLFAAEQEAAGFGETGMERAMLALLQDGTIKLEIYKGANRHEHERLAISVPGVLD
jgi:hypothetical protein